MLTSKMAIHQSPIADCPNTQLPADPMIRSACSCYSNTWFQAILFLSAQCYSMGNDLIQIGNAPSQGGLGMEVLSTADRAVAPGLAGDGN